MKECGNKAAESQGIRTKCKQGQHFKLLNRLEAEATLCNHGELSG